MYSFHFVLLYYLSNTIIQTLASVKHNCEKMIHLNIRGILQESVSRDLLEMSNKKAANHEDLLLIFLIFIFCNNIIRKMLIELAGS